MPSFSPILTVMDTNYYRHLIEQAPFGYAHHRIILDAQGNPVDYEFLEVNPAFERLTGLCAADIIGRQVTEVIPGIRNDAFDWIGYYGKIALHGGETNFEQFSDLLGKWYKVQVYSTERLFFSTTFMDITERFENNRKIEESERKYRLLTEFASDVIWVLNLTRKSFSYISPAVFDLRGITAEEAMAEKLEDSMTAESVAVVQKAIAENLSKFLSEPEKPQLFLDEIRQPRKDGSLVWVEVSTKFRYNELKEIEIVGVSRNVEARKKMERELVAAKGQAEKASRAKSEFLAIMSHELRTPLNSVIGFTDLLKDTPLGKTQKLYVENIGNSGHTLLAVINDILDLSKIEAGRMELEFTETDIIELAEQTADIMKYQASKKNLEFLLDIEADVPRYATVDPVRLKQILVNLLGNAVKFTHSGEVELSLSFKPRDTLTGFFTFSVRDTGIGIAEDQKHKLFAPFSQADASSTRRFGGTGLGLAISNMLAGKMGSSIEFKSGSGSGSRFFFTLETGFRSSANRPAEGFTRLSRVLVVDDNARSGRILALLCGRWGIGCACVDNGLDALRLLERHEAFDAVIVDYHMPYLGGIETVKQIQNLSGYRSGQLPVILLHSPCDGSDVEQECKKQDIPFNLSKPVKAAELRSCFVLMESRLAAAVQRRPMPVAERQAGTGTSAPAPDDVLAKLQALLEVNDLACIEWFERVKDLGSYDSDRSSFDELERCISDLDFEKALYVLEGMHKG